MFAKDTKIYHEINNAEDTLALPSDLDCLEYWTRNWQVTFNPQQIFVRGGSAPRSNLLPFYIPLFTKKVALSYTFY